jgi:hypothetical protein
VALEPRICRGSGLAAAVGADCREAGGGRVKTVKEEQTSSVRG